MSVAWLVLLIAGLCIAYAIIAGLVAWLWDEFISNSYCSSDDGVLWGAFWPVALVAWPGILIYRQLDSLKDRLKKRREKKEGALKLKKEQEEEKAKKPNLPKATARFSNVVPFKPEK